MGFTTDRFLMNLYHDVQPGRNLCEYPKEELQAEMNKRRALLVEKMGLDILKKYEMNEPSQCIYTEQKDGYIIEKMQKEIAAGLIQPFYVLSPACANGKTVIYCHGHDEPGARGTVYELEDKPYHKMLPVTLVNEGYTVIVHEPFAFGEMKYENYSETEQRGCHSNNGILQICGLNMTGIRVFQVLKMIDYAIMHYSKEIYVGGISGGGLAAAMVGSVDQRIKGTFVLCYTNTFLKSIMSIYHCLDNYMPGMLEVGECHEIMALSAPKPMLISGGDKDPIFPVSGTIEAANHIRQVYECLGLGDRVTVDIFDGEHEVNTPGVTKWLRSQF